MVPAGRRPLSPACLPILPTYTYLYLPTYLASPDLGVAEYDTRLILGETRGVLNRRWFR